jgi:metal-dependent amidase/aminoacylase/carboxypeptidase family protein
VNHQEAVQWFREAVKGASQEDLVPVMGAEDFSYYGKHIPACFFMLGLLPEGQETYPGLHTPQFDFNDEAIPYGIEAFCQIALHE